MARNVLEPRASRSASRPTGKVPVDSKRSELPPLLNNDEEIVLAVLTEAAIALHIAEIAAACWPKGTPDADAAYKTKGDKHVPRDPHGRADRGISPYRRALNAHRKLVKHGLVQRVGSGTYAATDRGRETVELASEAA